MTRERVARHGCALGACREPEEGVLVAMDVAVVIWIGARDSSSFLAESRLAARLGT